MNFPKGIKIGHLGPSIDNLAQIPINSATTQWMLPETVKPDSFTPPKYQLDSTTQQQLDFLLRTFKDQFTKDETTIGTTPLTQMSIDTGDSDPVSQKPYPVAMKHYQWVKEEINKTLRSRCNQEQPLQLVGTYHCSAERRWRQVPRNRLQSTQQGHKEICVANAQGRRCFLTMVQNTSPP